MCMLSVSHVNVLDSSVDPDIEYDDQKDQQNEDGE